MPRDHIAERCLSAAASSAPATAPPAERYRSRGTLQLVQKPQPLLREGQRHLGGRACGTSGASAAPPRKPRRQRRHRRRLEQGADRKLDTETARMRLTSRVASSECPPSSKKLSSMPTREPEHLGEQLAQISSCGVRGARCAGRRRQLRRGQRPAVELAVRRQRQRVERPQAPSAPCSPAALRQPARSSAGRAPPGARDHIGDQPLVAALSSRAITAACAHAGCGAAPPRSRPARCGSRGS